MSKKLLFLLLLTIGFSIKPSAILDNREAGQKLRNLIDSHKTIRLELKEAYIYFRETLDEAFGEITDRWNSDFNKFKNELIGEFGEDKFNELENAYQEKTTTENKT